MKKERKIYVVGGGRGYANWTESTIVSSLEEADLVLFTGGADVDPKIYGEPRHPYTASNISRDLEEAKIFQEAVCLKKHILGICRGSQFLCVMNGGKLVQHQENPSFIHPIETYDAKNLLITSTHHQAQYPWRIKNYKILAWTRGLSRIHQDGDAKELKHASKKECEIVYYPETKALGIQGHPEMMFNSGLDKREETIEYLQKLLDKHMKDAIV